MTEDLYRRDRRGGDRAVRAPPLGTTLPLSRSGQPGAGRTPSPRRPAKMVRWKLPLEDSTERGEKPVSCTQREEQAPHGYLPHNEKPPEQVMIAAFYFHMIGVQIITVVGEVG